MLLTQDVSENRPSSADCSAALLGGNNASSAARRVLRVADARLQRKTGQATVNEIEPTVNIPGYVTFQIRHFSGYVVAIV